MSGSVNKTFPFSDAPTLTYLLYKYIGVLGGTSPVEKLLSAWVARKYAKCGRSLVPNDLVQG